MPMNRTASSAAMYARVDAAFLASGRLERRDAGGDGLGAGQGHGAGREGPQQQDQRERLERRLRPAS